VDKDFKTQKGKSMKKFEFDEKECVWSEDFRKAGFGTTHFIYEPLAMETFIRGRTKDNQSIYLVVWTTPDEYQTNAILVLTKYEYEEEYEKLLHNPEYDNEGDGGNPNIPITEYSSIDEDKLKGIINYCDIDWEEFKKAISS
jgi:hypothetical protein